MLLTYKKALHLIKEHVPEPNPDITLNQMLNKLYIHYRPDYQGDLNQATLDLTAFNYTPKLDSYKPSQNGVFGAIYQVVQEDLRINHAISTDTSNPCLVASYIDTIRFNNVKKQLARTIPDKLDAPDSYNNQTYLVYQINKILNKGD